ncbi:hypothetical protein Q1695_011203 [Nippostrongylus brasiliensis]|nr:hypothetical protein Q1695_011203 [Nippostrongylus brasiliensis]
MMRNERRQQLDRSLLVLSREMDVDDVLVYLQGKGIFTDAVVDKILSAGGLGAQRTAIVRAVKCRGDRAYDAFFRALLHARQPHLADLLRPLVDEAVLQSLENESELPTVSRMCTRSISKMDTTAPLPPMQLAGVLEDLRVDMIDGDGTPEMEMFLRNRDSIYPNFCNPKGLCLIINNENFTSMPRRHGTDIDRANLKNLFRQLGYTVIVENDLNCKEMLARVRSFANDPEHKHASSAIVVVLTHGERDQLLGVGGDDDILSVYPFLEALNARNAPFLAGKPKLIFIQACRGDRRDTGVSIVDQVDSLRQENDGLLGLFNCVRPAPMRETCPVRPRESDFLIAYATPPTYVSWRNSLRGSWFVQAICEVFAKHARNADILQLLTKMPEFHSRLVKQFYFFPGITRSSSV